MGHCVNQQERTRVSLENTSPVPKEKGDPAKAGRKGKKNIFTYHLTTLWSDRLISAAWKEPRREGYRGRGGLRGGKDFLLVLHRSGRKKMYR